jgi:hypothetical protein
VTLKGSVVWGMAVAVTLVASFTSTSNQANAQTGVQQSGTAQKPLMSEEAFKNVQVLRGIPVVSLLRRWDSLPLL